MLRLARALLLLCAVPALATAPSSPEAEAERFYQQGVTALREKDGPKAAQQLTACVERAPKHVACHWELGWAHWLAQDWEQVVVAWEAVLRLAPSHPEVAGRLTEAKGQLELRQKLAAMDPQAPTVKRALPPGVSLRLRAVGDVMLGTDFPEGYLPPEDGALMLLGVKDWLQDADLTFINLEGPLCDDPRPSDKCRPNSKVCYAFRTPTRYARYLVEAGVDLASTANNHSGDFGEVCRRQTEATLDAAGIRWSGAPGTVASLEKNGLKVAMIGFHTSGATNSVNDHRTAAALVKSQKATHDVVIVSFHGGAEGSRATRVPHGKETFHGENRGDLRTFAKVVVDAGADLVLGHGPHVLRGMEIYKDRLVAYSLGNFATYGRFNLSGPLAIGVVLEVVVDGQGRFVQGRILPTRQVDKGVPVKDPEGTAIKQLRLLSEEDFPHTGVLVDSEGNFGPRPSPAPLPKVKVKPAGGR